MKHLTVVSTHTLNFYSILLKFWIFIILFVRGKQKYKFSEFNSRMFCAENGCLGKENINKNNDRVIKNKYFLET